jgi:hypothetical protein
LAANPDAGFAVFFWFEEASDAEAQGHPKEKEDDAE